MNWRATRRCGLSAGNTISKLTANLSGFGNSGTIVLRIVYLCPRSGSSNPHRPTIRERGKIVFSLEWLDGEQLRSSYRPGEWGRVMRECLKTPSGMRV